MSKFGRPSGRPPLSKLYGDMAKGNPEASRILRGLAKTARVIDPSCPLGPYGVLESVQRYGLKPDEIVKLYKLCDSDVAIINAIDYAVYWTGKGKIDFLSLDELKSHLKNNFRDLNPDNIMRAVKAANPRFCQYHHLVVK